MHRRVVVLSSPRLSTNRNALFFPWSDVQVLVTEAADKDLFKAALPTERDGVSYVIVHKPLVLDGWLQTGRAATVRQAKLRYEGMTGSAAQQQRGKEMADALAAAAGDDEDDDDVFAMLELVS